MKFRELSFVNSCDARTERNLKCNDIQIAVNSWHLLLHEANGDLWRLMVTDEIRKGVCLIHR